jgi:hypothetical protein
VRGRGRGRGRGGNSRTLEFGEIVLSDDEEISEGSKEEYEEEEAREDGVLDVGGQLWVLGAGRTVDHALCSGYARAAEYKLHNFTEKRELIFFQSVFPISTVEGMATRMTSKGVELGFGSSWAVTHGEVWRSLGYDMAIMVLHS